MEHEVKGTAQSEPRGFSRRFLIGLLCLTAVIVLLHVVLKYISVVIYKEQHGFFFELSNRFDLNDENSVPQWFTQVIFLAIALTAGLAAYLTRQKRERHFWVVLAVFGLILSVDDVSTLHEFVLQSLHNTFFVDTAPTIFRNAWLLLLPFILAGFGWLAVRMFQLLPKRSTVTCVVGGVIFIIGAVVVDSLTNSVPARSFAGQGLMAAAEGGLQLLGSSVFLYALADYIEGRHGRRLAAAFKVLHTH